MRLIPLLIAAVLLAATLTACGGSSSATTPTATPTPLITSAAEALDIVKEQIRPYFQTDPYFVNTQRMSAGESARVTQDMGLESLPKFAADGLTCPADAFCPYPGIPADEPGYLVLATGTPLVDAPSAIDNGQGWIQASWISDSSSTEVAPPRIQQRQLQSNGSYVTIYPTDWYPADPTDLDAKIAIMVATGGGCDDFERLDVVETTETVGVYAFYRETTRPDEACTLELNVEQKIVTLSAPLGNRTLQGCDGSPIPYFDEVSASVDCHPHRERQSLQGPAIP